MNFCDKCKKIVPPEQIEHREAWNWRGEDIPESYNHTYEIYTNLATYSPGYINCCMGMKTIYCGKITEPTEEEYYLYILCGINEGYDPEDD